MFAFPSLTFELSQRKEEREVYSVVLTEADGSRVYVSCMRWWERADDSMLKATLGAAAARERRGTMGKVTDDGALMPTAVAAGERVMYAPKCVLLTSHWPFFTQMENYLTALYGFITTTSPTLPYPLERSLQNLISETPLPPPGQLQVEAHPLPSLTLLFSRPPPNALPLHDFSTLYLFRLLSPDNVLQVFSAVSVEKRVLFVSRVMHRLTLSAESALSLLFPFFWRNIYIPLLPQQLLEFTCAPMPFIMGCPSPYKPELDLLDGVLVVDLDTNSVTWNGNPDERPPPLPPQRSPPLLKSLKRLFGDLSTPLRPGVAVDEDELHACFVRFFARLFSSYRDHILPPSDYSPDKFDRAAYLATMGDDRTSGYLIELLDSQMFGSFIDDRYEDAGAQSALDVLIFDEWIEREANRPTPFLSDTSHDHLHGKRYMVPMPYADDLDSNVYRYQTFPQLTPTLLCPHPRIPPLLSQPSVSQHATPASLSMKFFTEKRLYSQYFHSLRLRSSKHDLLLKDVIGWCRESARVEEERYRGMAELCRATVLKESVETDTSLDVAWYAVRQFVSEQSMMEEDMFRAVREDSFVPLSTSVSACEHQLRLLFSEATALEGKAAKLKSASERSKAKAKALEHRYVTEKQRVFSSTLNQATSGQFPTLSPTLSTASLLNGLSSSSSSQFSSSFLLPPQQLYALIQLRSEQEEAALEQDEDEESFTSIVHEYEERMPEIVDSIKQLNRERLEVYKASMKRWCEGRRGWLEGMMGNLRALEDAVERMDIDHDMRLLTEGAADFNRILNTGADVGTKQGGGGGKEAGAGVREQKEQSKVAPADSLHPQPAAPPASRPNGVPLHGKRPSADGLSVVGNSLSGPSPTPSVLVVEGEEVKVGEAEPASSPRTSLTITTTSPPVDPSRKPPEEEQKERGASTSSSSSSPSNGRKSRFLVSSIEVPSPTSAPHAPQVVKRASERGRSLSSASASQPNSPAVAASPHHSPMAHPVPAHPPSITSSLFPTVRQGSSPRLNTLHSSHSLTSLSSHSPHHPSTNSSSLASTFLSQIKKQHTAEDRRDAQRQAKKAKETAEWKSITTSSLNELTPSYALNLWGEFGFDVACQQGVANKRAVKEMTMELEQWAMAMEGKKKRWEATLLMLPKTIGAGGGQAKVWEQMRQRVSLHAKAYADYLSTVYRCITDLKLDKGELKWSVKRYGEHKAKLERELAAASDAVAKAAAKRLRALQALQQVEGQQKGLEPMPMTQKQLEANAAVVDKAIRDFKEADHEWSVSERDRTACQRKHDGCVARMLLLLEKKDTSTGLAIKRVLNVLADQYVVQFVHAIRRGDEQLSQAVKAVDLNKDLTEFLYSTYDSITPASVKIKPGDRVDFSTHLRFLSSNAFAVLDNLLLRSIDSLRVLIDLVQQLAETEEADSKALKKVVSPVRSMTNTSVQLALTSFDVWLERQVEMGEEQGRVLRSLTDPLTKMKSSMKTAEKAKEKQFVELERVWKKAQDERERAAYEERKAEDAFQQAKQRVEKAQRDAEGGAPGAQPHAAQKGFFSSLTTSSLESLRGKQQGAEADLRIARSFTKSKEKAMEEERVKRETWMASIMREMQGMEEKKWALLLQFYSTYMERHRAYIDRCLAMVNTFRAQIKGMDVHLDLMDFLARHQGNAPPPMVVLEGEMKRKEDAEREEREKEEERKRREAEEERSRTTRSRRTRISPSHSQHSRLAAAALDADPSNPHSQPRTPNEHIEGEELLLQQQQQQHAYELSMRRPLPTPPILTPIVSASNTANPPPAAVDTHQTDGARTPPRADVAVAFTAAAGAAPPGGPGEGPKAVSPSSSTSQSGSSSNSTTPPLSPHSTNSSSYLSTAGPFPPPRPPRPAHPPTRIVTPRSPDDVSPHPPAVPPHPIYVHPTDASALSPPRQMGADGVAASTLVQPEQPHTVAAGTTPPAGAETTTQHAPAAAVAEPPPSQP